MRHFKINSLCICILLFVAACVPSVIYIDTIGTMPGEEPGYEKGVSACYATVSDGTMLLAGGCNFPETPAADGGEKRYYKGIYSASCDGSALQWKKVGELPEASAYGVSLQYGASLVIAGGMNENGASDKAYIVEAVGDGCCIRCLPSLPCTVDNASGTVCGNYIYVVGGNADGRPSSRVFALNMDDLAAGWCELPSFPGRGRVQPVCVSAEGVLYLWGGFTPAGDDGDAVVHCDGAKYNLASGEWSLLPTIVDENNQPLTLSGGAAVATADGRIFAAGGVNREIFEDAISGKYNCVPKNEYMRCPIGWYRFNDRLLGFDAPEEKWEILTRKAAYARAGAVLATDGENLYYVGGELKPGIRTPEIKEFSFLIK